MMNDGNQRRGWILLSIVVTAAAVSTVTIGGSLLYRFNVAVVASGHGVWVLRADVQAACEHHPGCDLSDVDSVERMVDTLVAQQVIEAEVTRRGLRVDNEAIARRLLDTFRGADGRFDDDAYQEAIERSGADEQAFHDRVRRHLEREQLAAQLGPEVDLEHWAHEQATGHVERTPW